MPEPGGVGTVAITGASGFVGRYASTWLASRGYRVRAVTRAGLQASAPSIDVAQIPDDANTEALRSAFGGAHAVLHLAGRAHVLRDAVGDPLAAYRTANVEAARRALEAAAAAGATCFILASSVKAMGERTDAPWTEQSEARPLDPYGVSKLEAEAVVAEEGKRFGLRTVSFRLPLIYGPGMKANMLRLFGAVDRGLPLPFGAIENRRSLLFVGNAAAAFEAALRAGGAGSGLYLLSDGTDLSTGALVRGIAEALGRPARLLPIPQHLFTLAGWLGDGIASLVAWPLTSATVQRLTDSLQVDCGLARRELGFDPPYSVEAGLRETAAWYRSRGTDTA